MLGIIDVQHIDTHTWVSVRDARALLQSVGVVLIHLRSAHPYQIHIWSTSDAHRPHRNSQVHIRWAAVGSERSFSGLEWKSFPPSVRISVNHSALCYSINGYKTFWLVPRLSHFLWAPSFYIFYLADCRSLSVTNWSSLGPWVLGIFSIFGRSF